MTSTLKTSLMIIKKRKKATKQIFSKAHFKPYTSFLQSDIQITVQLLKIEYRAICEALA